MKNFSVSFSNWVFFSYFENYKGNRSRFIEEMFLKGVASEISEGMNYEQRILELTRINRNLELENRQLNRKLNSIKGLISPQLKSREDFVSALRDSGALHKIGDNK